MKTGPRSRVLLVGGLFLALSAAEAQAQAEKIVLGERFRIRSAVLNEDRELRVAKPDGYDRAGTAYPVLYVLDGDANFLVTAEIARFLAGYQLIPEMIVVGVTNTDRNRDMTPDKLVDAPPEHLARYATAGGADRFLKFLAEEAIPEIDKRYRTLPSRTIAGHSLSGLLVVHALIARPDLFTSYIAVSPAVFWNQFEYFDKIQAFYRRNPALTGNAYFSLADESEKDPKLYARFEDAFRKSAPKGLKVYVQFFKQENHVSNVVVSTVNALQKFFRRQA